MFGLFKTKSTAYTNIDVRELQAMQSQHKDLILLDVRTEGEARQGIIPGSKVINLMSPSFQKEVSKLPKNKHTVVYCRSGNRSAQACEIMHDLGFEHLYNLKGGIGSWTGNIKR